MADAVAESTDRALVLALLSAETAQTILRLLSELPIAFDCRTALPELLRGDRDGDRPGLVLLDVDLVEQGAKALFQVRRRFPHALLIAMGHGLTGDRSAALLVHGVPWLCKPVAPRALADLITYLSASARAASHVHQRSERAAHGSLWKAHLEHVLRTYASRRALSAQQQVILDMYLTGEGDKEIASACGCSLSTVYEHWRRMARKVGGSCKQHVIADFHRFLAGG